MFSLKRSAEISLVFLILLWQPSLKYNQLFRVIVAKVLRISNMAAWGCVTSPESLFQALQDNTDTMWHVVWFWPWENVHSYQRCTVDPSSVVLCQRGRLSTHQAPSIRLTGPHGKWQLDPQHMWVSSTTRLRVWDRSIGSGRRLAVSM